MPKKRKKGLVNFSNKKKKICAPSCSCQKFSLTTEKAVTPVDLEQKLLVKETQQSTFLLGLSVNQAKKNV